MAGADSNTVESKATIFNKAVMIFVLGSVFGTYYEQILHLVKHLLKYGSFSWVSRRSLIYGPFSLIYGLGAVLVYLFFCHKKRPWYKNFIYGGFLGGVYEFVMSWLQENIWGTISWDYSGYFLDIGGRTTVPFMAFWGLLALLFVDVFYPLVNKLYYQISEKKMAILASGLAAVLIFDMIISATAVFRQTQRHRGVPANTFIDHFCDYYYTDEYLKKVYDNSWRVTR